MQQEEMEFPCLPSKLLLTAWESFRKLSKPPTSSLGVTRHSGFVSAQTGSKDPL